MKRPTTRQRQKTPPETTPKRQQNQLDLLDYLARVEAVLAETAPDEEARKSLFAELSAATDRDGL